MTAALAMVQRPAKRFGESAVLIAALSFLLGKTAQLASRRSWEFGEIFNSHSDWLIRRYSLMLACVCAGIRMGLARTRSIKPQPRSDPEACHAIWSCVFGSPCASSALKKCARALSRRYKWKSLQLRSCGCSLALEQFGMVLRHFEPPKPHSSIAEPIIRFYPKILLSN